MTVAPSTAPVDELRRLAHGLIQQATSFVAPTKLKETARRLVAGEGAELILEDDYALDLAEILAFDLALYAPSLTGSTSLDRLARQHRPSTPAEAEALRLLRGARFCLFKITAQLGQGLFAAEDLATGARFTLDSETMSTSAVGFELGSRLCWVRADVAFPILPAFSLNAQALNAAQIFIRPGGKGLSNPQRCAEAVYREALRGLVPLMDGAQSSLPSFFESPLHEDGLPWSEGLIHDVASRWAQSSASPSADEIQDVRDHATFQQLAEALENCVVARQAGWTPLAAAYENIIVLQLETIHRRGVCGVTLGVISLDSAAAELRQLIACRSFPPAILDLFEELRRRVQVRSSSRRSADTDLDKVLARIQALRAKTVEQGCTEQEAILAARKVAELLDRYGLSLSEVDLKNQACEGVGIETDRRRVAPIDECIPEIAVFCDCRVWHEATSDGRRRYIFFGMPADVAAARYLYELIERAFADETYTFKCSPAYAEHPTGTRRSASNSFQIGLAHGIRRKLQSVRAERTTAMQSSGRDLVPIKHALVEDELAKLGLNFTRKALGRRRNVLRHAYDAGHEAGSRFEVRHGIESD